MNTQTKLKTQNTHTKMKKSGGAADKKRVRRSSGAVTNASRDLNSDTPPREIRITCSVVMRDLKDANFVAVKSLQNSGLMLKGVACLLKLPRIVLTRNLLLMYVSLINRLKKKQAAKKDVFQLFAEKVRDHKDLVSRWAVLQETRVEYFRGKDFVSFLKNHSEVKDILESNNNLEVEEIANTLLSKNLLVRCDRVVKTVRPGKKKLSTWPAHLEIFPDQVFSENDAFFAWAFVKRRPLWQTLLSLSWPVLTLAICMFPVYPHRCKLLILYSCAGLLLLILSLLSCKLRFCFLVEVGASVVTRRSGVFSLDVSVADHCRTFPSKTHHEISIIIKFASVVLNDVHLHINHLFKIQVRATVFGVLYLILGKRVWFFPNILAEEATLGELFRFWPNKDEEERPKWTTRLFYALVAVLVILLLRHHAPDEAARARYQKRMSNIIDEVLEWSPSLALSGMMEKQPTVVNTTEPGNFTDSGKTDSEKESPADDEGGETILEQHEDEETENIEDTDQHQHQDHI
ncbi:hypothetical protein POTOM_032814 [Populus tomentosa]|uniref:Translocation protein SEC62 n=1 Tax=Populus tomentosa TaxID=118781 RepID=A0A8X8CH20_POPTO|nr:hypothetical protein POTOM_032814 [Populus tomentosa]